MLGVTVEDIAQFLHQEERLCSVRLDLALTPLLRDSFNKGVHLYALHTAFHLGSVSVSVCKHITELASGIWQWYLVILQEQYYLMEHALSLVASIGFVNMPCSCD